MCAELADGSTLLHHFLKLQLDGILVKVLLPDELVSVLLQAGHLLLLLANKVLEGVMGLEVGLHLLYGGTTLRVAQGNLLRSGSGQNLLHIPQVEVHINELVEVDLLVLPGSVKLLPLCQNCLNPCSHLTLGTMALSHHRFTQGNHLTEGLFPGLNFSLEVVMLCLEHLCRGSIRDLLLCDEGPAETRGPGQQVPHHSLEGVVVGGGEEGGLPLARPLLQLHPGGEHLLLGRQHLGRPLPGVASLQGGAVIYQHLQLGLKGHQVILKPFMLANVRLSRLCVSSCVLCFQDCPLLLNAAESLGNIPVEPVDLPGSLKSLISLLDLIDEVPPLGGELSLA